MYVFDEKKISIKYFIQGFHVHRDPLEKDVVNCSAAGPHFNPYGQLKQSLINEIGFILSIYLSRKVTWFT